MNLSGITWSGPTIDDSALLAELPQELAELLGQANGFILHHGALHFRGASLEPAWHSLRHAWRGPESFQKLYPQILPNDIPFAQDQFGDQFLWRDGTIIRLSAETGDTEVYSPSLRVFLAEVAKDIETFLNVGLQHQLKPGQLLYVYPPFCTAEAAEKSSMTGIAANHVILFHADVARQIRNIPEGEKTKLKWGD